MNVTDKKTQSGIGLYKYFKPLNEMVVDNSESEIKTWFNEIMKYVNKSVNNVDSLNNVNRIDNTND